VTAWTLYRIAISNIGSGANTIEVQDNAAVDVYVEAMSIALDASSLTEDEITPQTGRITMQISFVYTVARIGAVAVAGGLLSLAWTIRASFDVAAVSAGIILFGIGLLAASRFWMLYGRKPAA